MLDWLGCLLMGVFVDRCSLADARILFDALQKAVATAAIVVGGLWAYLKFVRGRTFRLRLEPSVGGLVWREPGPEAALYLLIDCRARNAGLSKFRISVEESALQVFTSAAAGPSPAPAAGEAGATAEPVGWEELGGYAVFEDSGAAPLEPAEQAQDEILLELPGGGPAALKLVLTVTARARRGRSWTVTRGSSHD